jgi:predicted membrane-bound spermidine synthase
MRALLPVVFALSGASGLILEVAWVRNFGNVFGSTVHSASLVTAIFMCGLGVGALLAGRIADRNPVNNPARLVRLYARFELGIAALGLALAWAIPALGLRSRGRSPRLSRCRRTSRAT